MKALIGYTGFVGSNLSRQRHFDVKINRTNLNEIEGVSLDQLVISALPAEKWRINQHPEADLANLRVLQRSLDSITARQVVLISTVDVYGVPLKVDEKTHIVIDDLHPYGLHRYEFENWVSSRFESCLVVRLPGLFGWGLKKNALYDLLHDHEIERLNPSARLQWYPISRLADDIDRALALNLQLVNASVEPVSLFEIADRYFPLRHLRAQEGVPACYDVRSIYSSDFGGQSSYWMHAEGIFEELGRWLEAERTVSRMEIL
jgi:nucleoside-diphosphate-sugar epimerase